MECAIGQDFENIKMGKKAYRSDAEAFSLHLKDAENTKPFLWVLKPRKTGLNASAVPTKIEERDTSKTFYQATGE